MRHILCLAVTSQEKESKAVGCVFGSSPSCSCRWFLNGDDGIMLIFSCDIKVFSRVTAQESLRKDSNKVKLIIRELLEDSHSWHCFRELAVDMPEILTGQKLNHEN